MVSDLAINCMTMTETDEITIFSDECLPIEIIDALHHLVFSNINLTVFRNQNRGVSESRSSNLM